MIYNNNFKMKRNSSMKDVESGVKKLEDFVAIKNMKDFKNINYNLQSLEFRVKKF
jgi:hypothetical protein